VTSENARGAGGTIAPSASAGLDNLDQTVAAGNVLVLNSRTVLETRGQFARGDLEAPPTDLIGPAVSIAGVATFGRLSTSPTARLNSMVQVVNNLVHQAGDHAVRAGVDLLYNDDTITFPRAVKGSYAFSSLPIFLPASTTTPASPRRSATRWSARPTPTWGRSCRTSGGSGSRVTLNAGLRYELQYLDAVETDTNNVSPRAGVTWSPSESRRTLVRASAGRFYDRVPLRAVANALLSANNTTDLASCGRSASVCRPGNPARPCSRHPARRRADHHARQSDHYRQDLQNAHSNQAGIE
jgi:hypothetical protein